MKYNIIFFLFWGHTSGSQNLLHCLQGKCPTRYIITRAQKYNTVYELEAIRLKFLSG